MHPLTPNLRELTDEELLSKINELYKKLRIAYSNPPVYAQLQNIMDDYQFEQKRRLQEQREKFENNELNKKIDIK